MAVFISYNSRDGDAIPRELKSQLDKALGDCTFVDRDSIKPGAEWLRNIEQALSRARVFFLVVGPQFFSEEQRARLAAEDSVIRKELETARNNPACRIIPAYFDCEPPHRTERPWPDGLSWLGDLQWTELRQDRLALDLQVISAEICRELARGAIERLLPHAGAVDLTLAIETSTPEVVNAMVVALRNGVPQNAQVERQLVLLQKIKMKGFDVQLEHALSGTGDFAGIQPWLRATSVLVHVASNPARGRIAGLEVLDHVLRRKVADDRRGIDRRLETYVSIALLRLRERLDGQHLDAPAMLQAFFDSIRRLPPPQRQRLDSAILALNRWGFATDPGDKEPLLGRGPLPLVVRLVERRRPGPRGRHRGRHRRRG